MIDLITRLLDQDHRTRLGCGAEGVDELLRHPYWKGGPFAKSVEWELLPLKKFESPCKGLHAGQKTSKKKQREKAEAAVEVAPPDCF